MRWLAACLALLAVPAQAAVNVFACEPEWAALAQEIGGARVAAFSATTAQQDPHHIEARPSLIARMRSANLVICTGAELEAGWLPLLQRQAGARAPLIEASRLVELVEKPASLDRSLGDIHAAGNPHIHTDPRNLLPVAAELAARLRQIDASGAAEYDRRLADFRVRWQAAIARWEQQAAPLRGLPVMVHHRNFSYLLRWLGMRETATLEPKPGLEPSAAHLLGLLEAQRAAPARMVLYAAYQSDRPAQFMAERTGIPAVQLPYTVGGSPQAGDLGALFDDTVARLLAALR